jgi:hypothetical protein
VVPANILNHRSGRISKVLGLKLWIVKLAILIHSKRSAGELFAMCPVDAHPGVAVEPVSDSSRYFVLRLADPSGNAILWNGIYIHNFLSHILIPENTDSLP